MLWEADVAFTTNIDDSKRMHTFPDTLKLQFLVGAEIEQVCFGPWQIQFNFDKGHIRVDGELEHLDKSGKLSVPNVLTTDTRRTRINEEKN